MTSNSRTARALVVAMSCCVAALVLVACGSGGGDTAGTGNVDSPMPTGAQANDQELLQGRRLFAANCAACHGASGQGGVGPTFQDGRLLRDFPDVQGQVEFVRTGRGVMPSFSGTFDDEELLAVVRYEREVLSKSR